MPRTIDDVILGLPPHWTVPELKTPYYDMKDYPGRVALAVPSMAAHMSNEGWQLMQALQSSGYRLFGHGLGGTCVVRDVLEQQKPGVVIVQDKREWATGGNYLCLPHEAFENTGVLAEHNDIFKLTILKDSHQRPAYHSQAANEIGCHAWIVYYHPRIVKHLSGFVRPQHLIRTWHSIDSKQLVDYSSLGRKGALLSGAISIVYPLRWKLLKSKARMPDCDWLPHPGYHNRGTNTNEFLSKLIRYKVAICTTSVYGYSLRKLIEATACGCTVLTDLPVDDVVPYIDGNLIRIEGKNIEEQLEFVVKELPRFCNDYDPEKQQHFAQLAKRHFDYPVVGVNLAADIETLRQHYNNTKEEQQIGCTIAQ